MHASLHDLLNLRDGSPVDAAVRRHVDGCATCAASLRQMRQLQAYLASTAGPEPPAGGWDRVAAALDARAWRSAERPRREWLAAGVAAAALIVLLVSRLAETPGHRPAARTAATAGPSAQLEPPSAAEPVDLSRLIAHSQSLEFTLERLPGRPRAERAGTALMLDTLEARIARVDATLLFAADAGLSEAEVGRLWQERVRLLDSLVNMRYAQAQHLAF